LRRLQLTAYVLALAVGVFGCGPKPPARSECLPHLTNASACCWVEFATRVIALANLVVDLAPIMSNVLGAPVRRPRQLVSRRLGEFGPVPLRPWPEARRTWFAIEGYLAAVPAT
jgi:dTDP-4-dehydrorhamnose reductase